MFYFFVPELEPHQFPRDKLPKYTNRCSIYPFQPAAGYGFSLVSLVLYEVAPEVSKSIRGSVNWRLKYREIV
jgi:hypothetical protein